jgi:hypothetical protein
VAAAISPWECPTTASGTTPAACHTAASDTITAHNTGCTTSTRSRSGAPAAPASTSPRSQSVYGASARVHSPSRAENTGEHTASSRPIPTHWPPCPGNTNTTRPASTSAVPVTTPAAGSPAATAAKAAASSSPLAPVTTARCSNADRVVASDHPTSATASSGRAATHSRNRPACARNASADRPDTSHATAPDPSTDA